MKHLLKIALLAVVLTFSCAASVADSTLKSPDPKPESVLMVPIVQESQITLQLCYRPSDSTYYLRGFVSYCDTTQFLLMAITLTSTKDNVQHPFSPEFYAIDTSGTCYRERFAGSIHGGLLRQLITRPEPITISIYGKQYGVAVKLDYGVRKEIARVFGWSELI